MGSSAQTVAWIAEQMAGAGAIRTRPMFGETGVYCDDVFVGVICADRLFLKVTAPGLAHDLPQAPAYTGAKPSLAVPQDRVEDAAWLGDLVKATARALARA